MPTYIGKKLEFTDQNGNIYRMIPVDSTEKGAAEGVATLDASGKVPAEQLPDTAHIHLYSTRSAFPSSGVDGDLYIDKDTNVIYRWDSTESDYISISSAGGSGVITVSGTITNTSGAYSGTFNDSRIVSTMKCILLELGTPSIFGGYVSVSCSDGSITITCDEVAGSSTFIASFIASMVSSTEYDALNNAKVDKVTTATSGNVVIFGSDGTIVDSEKTLGKSVPADAVFTDTTYSDATQSASGLMSSTDKTKLDGIATGATANAGTITGITMNGASKGTSGVVDLGTVITSHQDISGKVSGPSSATNNRVATFDGTTGKVIKDSGYTIEKSVPSNAVFTDTTYSAATQSAAGLMSAADKKKLDGVATGATANAGTITGIKMNGSSKGTSGVVDLGTVITSHQDISGKANKSEAIKNITRSGTTFTATKADGTTFTFTQQDNDTTYSAGAGIALSSGAFTNRWHIDTVTFSATGTGGWVSFTKYWSSGTFSSGIAVSAFQTVSTSNENFQVNTITTSYVSGSVYAQASSWTYSIQIQGFGW